METIDELLKGTKYEGAEHYLDGGSACSMSPNVAMQRVKRDALENAALASLLPAAVKAMRFMLKCKAEGVVSPSEPDSYEKGLEKLSKALTRISEATKAVEGKQ